MRRVYLSITTTKYFPLTGGVVGVELKNSNVCPCNSAHGIEDFPDFSCSLMANIFLDLILEFNPHLGWRHNVGQNL